MLIIQMFLYTYLLVDDTTLNLYMIILGFFSSSGIKIWRHSSIKKAWHCWCTLSSGSTRTKIIVIRETQHFLEMQHSLYI